MEEDREPRLLAARSHTSIARADGYRVIRHLPTHPQRAGAALGGPGRVVAA